MASKIKITAFNAETYEWEVQTIHKKNYNKKFMSMADLQVSHNKSTSWSFLGPLWISTESNWSLCGWKTISWFHRKWKQAAKGKTDLVCIKQVIRSRRNNQSIWLPTILMTTLVPDQWRLIDRYLVLTVLTVTTVFKFCDSKSNDFPYLDMSISTLLRMWNRSVDTYVSESRRILNRLMKQINEQKPTGDDLEDLVEQLGKSTCATNLTCE